MEDEHEVAIFNSIELFRFEYEMQSKCRNVRTFSKRRCFSCTVEYSISFYAHARVRARARAY